jgi:hypothetical protein
MVFMISSLNTANSFTEKLDTIRNPIVSLGACSLIAAVLLKQNTFLPKLLSLPVLFCASIINTNSLKNDPNPNRRTDAIVKSFALSLFVHLCTRPFSVVFSTLASLFAARVFAASLTPFENNPFISRRERQSDRASDVSSFPVHQTFILPQTPSAVFVDGNRPDFLRDNFASGSHAIFTHSPRQYNTSPSRVLSARQRHVVGGDTTTSHSSYATRVASNRHAEFSSSNLPSVAESQIPFSPEDSRFATQARVRFNDSPFTSNSANLNFAAPIEGGFAQEMPALSSVHSDLNYPGSSTSPSFGQSQQKSLRGKRHQVQSDVSNGAEAQLQLNPADLESAEAASNQPPRLRPGQRHEVKSENSGQQPEAHSSVQGLEARAAFAGGGASFFQQATFGNQTNEAQGRSAFAAPANSTQARAAFGRPN